MQMTETMETMADTLKDGATTLADRFKREPVRTAAPIVVVAAAVTTAFAVGYRMLAGRAKKAVRPGRSRR